MKKIAAAIAVILCLLQGVSFMSGCKKETNEETPFDYASLYRTEKTEAYKEEARATSRARYGYTKSSVQGYNDWYYLYGNKNTYSEMSFDSSSGIWQGDGAEMQEEEMRPSSSAAAVRMFKTERGGNAVVYGNYKCADSTSASAHIAIYAGEKMLYEGDLQAGDTVGKYFELSVSLNTDDELYFCVNGENSCVLFDPVVTFEGAQNESLTMQLLKIIITTHLKFPKICLRSPMCPKRIITTYGSIIKKSIA